MCPLQSIVELGGGKNEQYVNKGDQSNAAKCSNVVERISKIAQSCSYTMQLHDVKCNTDIKPHSYVLGNTTNRSSTQSFGYGAYVHTNGDACISKLADYTELVQF